MFVLYVASWGEIEIALSSPMLKEVAFGPEDAVPGG